MNFSSAPLVSKVPTTRTAGSPSGDSGRSASPGASRVRRGPASAASAASNRATGTGFDQRVGEEGFDIHTRAAPWPETSRDCRRIGVARSAGVVRHRPVPAVAPDPEQALLEITVGRKRRRVHDPVDAAVDHDRDVFRHRGGDPDVLLDDEDRDLPLLADPDQHVLDLLHDDRRESLGRFVHHQQARIEQQRAGDREHLLLTARELAAAARAPFPQAGNAS